MAASVSEVGLESQQANLPLYHFEDLRTGVSVFGFYMECPIWCESWAGMIFACKHCQIRSIVVRFQ